MRLSATPLTRAELTRRLKERGCPDRVARTLLDDAENCGIVDDRLYGLMYIQSHRDQGRRRLVDQLRLKGLSRETIEDLLDESEFDEMERALPLVRDYLGRFMEYPKIQGRLIRRGFSAATINEALRQMRQEKEETEE